MVNNLSKFRFNLVSAFAGVTCFLSLIQVACLYLGVLGVAMSQFLAMVIAFAAVGVSFGFAAGFSEPGRPAPAVENTGPSGARALIIHIPVLAAVAWAGWTWVRMWDLAWQRPPYGWDGLYYHIPAIHEWVMMGRIGWIDALPEVPFVNYPMGVEVLSFFGHYLFQTSRLLAACNLWYWPLAFLAIGVTAARLGARGPWPYFAGSLIAGVPVFICQSLTCYVDLGFCATVMAAIASALLLVFSKGRRRWSLAALMGMALGLMAGSKGTGLPFLLVIVAVTTVAALWIHGLDRWKSWLCRLVLVAAVSLIVGGFWYVRNFIKTGNPIYPIQLKLGEKVILEGYDYKQFNLAVLPQWLEKYPPAARMFVSWLQLDAPISGEAPVGGLGYIWLVGALPAMIIVCIIYFRRRGRGRYPARELALLLTLGLALMALQPAAWWSRFTAWFHVLGLSCLAVLASMVAAGVKRHWRYLPLLVCVLMLAAGSMWEAFHTLGLERQRGLVSAPDSPQPTYLTSLDYMFPGLAGQTDWSSFQQSTVLARSPMQGMGSLLVGILNLPLGEREIKVLPVPPADTDITGLKERNIKWVVWDVSDYGPVPEMLAAQADRRFEYVPHPDLNLQFLHLRLDRSQAYEAAGRSSQHIN